jgi:hypothetical protein
LIVPSRGLEVAVPWFRTAPIPLEKRNQITGVQFSTLLHDCKDSPLRALYAHRRLTLLPTF